MTELPHVPELPSQAQLDVVGFEPGSAGNSAGAIASIFQTFPLLYVQGVGWHVWSGTTWELDPEDLKTRALIIEQVRKLHASAFGTKLASAYSAKTGYINDILMVLKSRYWATADSMDAFPELLNTQTGVLDLTTFELQDHDPALRLTHITNAAYTGVIDDYWQQFLDTILPDREIQDYMQRLVGVSLLGKTVEHVLPIMSGTGANGKSTLINAILDAFGDYAIATEPSLFMTVGTDANAASPALLRLRGRRFVATVETESGKKLASALVKTITGGDNIVARALHKMPVEFQPSHSAFMATNFMPKVDGADAALQRRLKYVDFGVIIPEAERDPNLREKLQLHSSSVLSWAVEGLKQYRLRGLDTPQEVTASTADYFNENNSVGQFVNENFIVGQGGSLTSTEIQQRISEWDRAEEGNEPVSMRSVGPHIQRLGAFKFIRRINGNPTRGYDNIKLKE